jgi:hypothetical protein
MTKRALLFPTSPRHLLNPLGQTVCALLILLSCAGALTFWAGCGNKPDAPAALSAQQLSTHGSIEVTAQLVEIPEGAIFKRDLYDYATVLKYKVIKVHRGEVKGDFIYVAQYNPFKARQDAPDGRVKEIGGNLKSFQAGQMQRLALEVPVEDHFMGGLVNKYFGKTSDPIYWAVWTDLAGP